MRLLLIDKTLCAPPSEVCLFRDITLYGTVFGKMEVLLEAEKEEADYYYEWLRNNFAWDFVSDIVPPRMERGISIRPRAATICRDRLTYENYAATVRSLGAFINNK